MPAYLGLGSNRGNRVTWLRRGIGDLRAQGLNVAAGSSLWLTEPVGDTALNWFVNCVVRVDEPPAPEALLRAALEAERRCGRTRQPGLLTSRTFDADVLLYDSRVMDVLDLQIPHPRMCDRRFVLEPLAELAPELVHPVRRATIARILSELQAAERSWLLAPGIV